MGGIDQRQMWSGEVAHYSELELTWRKSSKSQNDLACIEVATGPDIIKMRDSKDRAGWMIDFTPRAWRAFIVFVSDLPFQE